MSEISYVIGHAISFMAKGEKEEREGVIVGFTFDKRVNKEYIRIKCDGKIFYKLKSSAPKPERAAPPPVVIAAMVTVSPGRPLTDNEKIQNLAIESFLETDECLRRHKIGTLFEMIRPKLKYYIWQFLRDDDNTEDVLSNTFEKILVNFNRFNQKWKFTTWAFNIAKNEALLFQYYRRKDVRMEFEDDMEDAEDFMSRRCHDPIDDEYSEEYDPIELYSSVLECIRQMPEGRSKDLLVDKRIHHMKGQEIADKYNMNLSTVKTNIRKATFEVRKILFEKHPYLKAVIQRNN